MLPGSILQRSAIGIALAFAALQSAAAQTEEARASQTIAMQALSDICAKDMPDLSKIQVLARKRWKGPQNLKGVDYWSVAAPGQPAFALGAGKQDTGHICLVSFSGRAAEVIPAIESRFNVTTSQVLDGKRIWRLTLNGAKGMVFLEDHPKSRFNVNAGIFLEPPPPIR